MVFFHIKKTLAQPTCVYAFLARGYDACKVVQHSFSRISPWSSFGKAAHIMCALYEYNRVGGLYYFAAFQKEE